MLSAFSTPAQARQALRAAGAGNEPELDLRQAEFRRRDRNPVMAHQRHFETAAERRAVDGGDDRLRAAFEGVLEFGKVAPFGGLPNSEISAPAMKVRPAQITTMALTAGSAAALRDAVAQPVAHIGRKRIDRRRIDRQHGDIAFAGQVGHGIDRPSRSSSTCRVGLRHKLARNICKGRTPSHATRAERRHATRAERPSHAKAERHHTTRRMQCNKGGTTACTNGKKRPCRSSTSAEKWR